MQSAKLSEGALARLTTTMLTHTRASLVVRKASVFQRMNSAKRGNNLQLSRVAPHVLMTKHILPFLPSVRKHFEWLVQELTEVSHPGCAMLSSSDARRGCTAQDGPAAAPVAVDAVMGVVETLRIIITTPLLQDSQGRQLVFRALSHFQPNTVAVRSEVVCCTRILAWKSPLVPVAGGHMLGGSSRGD